MKGECLGFSVYILRITVHLKYFELLLRVTVKDYSLVFKCSDNGKANVYFQVYIYG